MNYNIKMSHGSDASIIEFIKTHHYLKKSSRGNTCVFSLYDKETLVGVAMFGEPVGTYIKSKYGEKTLELKRFCLNNTPKNTASWFMARCIKLLRQQGWEKIITYADPAQGHEGVMYKACNFKYLGEQKIKTPYVIYKGSRIYGRQVYSGNPKYATLKKLVTSGKVKLKYAIPKKIFMYEVG